MCADVDVKNSGADQKTIIRYDYAPGEISTLCADSINETQAALDKLATIPKEARTLENTIIAFDQIITDFQERAGVLIFMNYIHSDEKLRDEATKCDEKVGPFGISIFTRKDLYDVFKDLIGRNKNEEKLISEVKLSFEENGLKLSDETLAKVKDLKSQLAVKETQFSSNLNSDTSTVAVEEKELVGVPSEVIARLNKQANEKYLIPAQGPLYMQVMENCSLPETRKKLITASHNIQAEKNVALLEDAILLREKIAALMGFSTWADYRVMRNMSKSGKNVLNFLNDLKLKLKERNKKDIDQLLTFKKELGPSSTEIYPWDIYFLSYQLKKRDFSLDNEVIREYFPAEKVVQGMFDIYEQLLGLKFVPVKNIKVWHTDVRSFEIQDKTTKKLIAYFFTDFYPRDGKYKHAAAFGLIGGRQLGTNYSIPVSSIVANFNAPTAEKPSLLNHDEVETIFHEFGHIMHQTLTRAPYGILAGTSVQHDFVEAPSQMMENWVWQPEILSKISGHYKDTKKKLPQDLVKKMIAAKDFQQGYFFTRQLFLGVLDMTYNTSVGAVDTTAVFKKLYKEITGIEPVENDHFQASFGHLMSGYDAGYYGYLWSLVYADDIFTKFKGKNILNSTVGQKYRKTILEQGNMKDGMNLLHDFLGRAPNNKAFFERLHIAGSN